MEAERAKAVAALRPQFPVAHSCVMSAAARTCRRFVAAALLAVSAAGAGQAAEIPVAAPPNVEDDFEDWRRICAGAACRIQFAVPARGPAAPDLLGLSVASDDPEVLVVRTPLPLHLPDGLSLTLGADDPISAPWRTCDEVGCDARLSLSGALLAGLRGERYGAVAFTLVDGERVRLPVSLMGFSAALRSLDAGSAPGR